MDLFQARLAVRSSEALAQSGISRSELARRRTSGELVALHPGRYVEANILRSAHEEDRHLLRIAAVLDATVGTTAVISHASAAVLHGLPLARLALPQVHFSGEHTRGVVHPGARIARHEVPMPESDVCTVAGVRVTTLERTVLDLLRSVPPETALAATDAALRAVAWREMLRRYDRDAAESFRHDLHHRIALLAGGRGIRQARWLLPLADGQAELPGESISRLYLLRLGFRRLRLQVVIPGPHGREYRSDIAVDDVPAWFEYDGVAKYVDPRMTGGRDVRGVVAAEKEREDFIRATTGRPVIRAVAADIASVGALASLLRRHGIRAPWVNPHSPAEPTRSAARGVWGSGRMCGFGR